MTAIKLTPEQWEGARNRCDAARAREILRHRFVSLSLEEFLVIEGIVPPWHDWRGIIATAIGVTLFTMLLIWMVWPHL